MATRAAPYEWQFNLYDYQRMAPRFWRLPERFVETGELKALLRPEGAGARRGGGSAASILPILAIHNWSVGSDAWTEWKPMPGVRRLARLGGIAPNTVVAATAHLRQLGLLDSRAQSRSSGGQDYRLSDRVFPHRAESFAMIPANLTYGGLWALLPTASSRHLLLAIAARSAVRAPKDYAVGARRDADESDAIGYLAVQRHRERHPYSISQIVDDTGLSVNSVRAALRALVSVRAVDTPGSSSPVGGLISIGPAEFGGIWIAPAFEEVEYFNTRLLDIANDAATLLVARAAIADAPFAAELIQERRQLGAEFTATSARPFWSSSRDSRNGMGQ